jgi:hypothetical protein
MNANKFAVGLCGLAIWTSAPAYSQQTTVAPNDDPKWVLVGRLDLERYKATLRGLGQYGDRQQGTDRNRAAVDWIEAQLRSYGCAPERIKYVYNSPGLSRDQQIVAHPPGAPVGRGIVMGLGARGSGHDAAGRPQQQSGGTDRFNTARPQRGALDTRAARGSLLHQGRLNAAGRDVYRGRSHGWTRLRGGD